MKKGANSLKIADVWKLAQTGDLSASLNHDSPTGYARQVSLEDLVTDLRSNPDSELLADAISDYLHANYRDAMRRLEKVEKPSRLVLALKVICLLQMAARDEMIVSRHPREYLRDSVLKDLKHLDDGHDFREANEWLERFCFGHDLPLEFWEIANKT